MKKYENSPYRIKTFDWLTSEWFRRKNWRRLADTYERLREERISDGLRDLTIFAEATAHLKTERPAEAIRVLGLADHPQAIGQREGLLRKYPEAAPAPAGPPRPKAPAAPAGAAPAVAVDQGFDWWSWPILCGLILAAAAIPAFLWRLGKRGRGG